MSAITETRITEITEALNGYDADPGNIWQDVILQLPEYDEAATDEIDNGRSDRFALADGTVIRYAAETGRWDS
jgi:hypothetical protein